MMMIERKTISIMKACELVGVSRRTIYNWIASGKIEYVRTAGGSVRIFVDTLWREPSRTADFHPKEASCCRCPTARLPVYPWTNRQISVFSFTV